MNRRVLFVRLPHFPTERFLKAERAAAPSGKPWWLEADEAEDDKPSNAPLVLVDHGPKGTRISASSPEAMALGLWPDMKLADARTMVPVMRVEQHDKAADANAHNRLAHWLTRWSPSVSPYRTDGFLLDTAGCDHLFGGEAAMADGMVKRLATLGFTARLAIADHVGAAIALVDHGMADLHILPPGHGPKAMDALPVEALRLDGDSVVLLKRLGLKCIGDVRPIPRPALERRFRERGGRGTAGGQAHAARSVQMRLDQLCGAISEPLRYIAPPQPFRVMRQCPDMALEQEAVGIALDGLLDDLCLMLTQAAKGARLFRLTAYRADGGTSSAQVRLSQPVRSPTMIARLFRERLEQIDCGYGVDLFALEGGNVERMDGVQSGLDGRDDAASSGALIAFADTVANRAGPRSVMCFAPRESHVPERAQRAVPVSQATDRRGWLKKAPIRSPRPLRLLSRPERADVTAELPDSPPVQFVWRRVVRKIIRSQGPERIMPEWWHDSLKSRPSASFRDYYDVEDTRGLRYWIFRAIHDHPLEEAVEIASAQEPATGWDHGGRLQNPTIETRPVQEIATVRAIEWFVHGLF
ncbi:DNA polymerase Y family protein [Rhizobiaceae bacterium]|nr:DNA polymerase Y family protein [Rhizobiaceae bacterium]